MRARLLIFLLSLLLGSTKAAEDEVRLLRHNKKKREGKKGKRQYIVCLKTAVPQYIVGNVCQRIAESLGAKPRHIYSDALYGFSVTLTKRQYEDLMSDKTWDPFIDFVEEDREVEAFMDVDLPVGIKRVGGDNPKFRQGNDAVNVAVLDTGVEAEHEDLNVVHCKSFVDNEEDACNDENGHGTHVAGTISGNQTGIAPGASVWAVQVLSKTGSGTIADLVAGIDYVVSNSEDISVLNLSLGSPSSPTTCDDKCNCGSDSLHIAVCNARRVGVVVVAASGNSGVDASSFRPASYDEAITVSAVADSDGDPGGFGPKLLGQYYDDEMAAFSNYGTSVDIAAPGVSVLSTWKDGKYRSISGTSMAAPHVAGAAVLYIAEFGMTSKDVTGVIGVRDGLLALASPQDSALGFTGDTQDSSHEPMLNVAGILESEVLNIHCANINQVLKRKDLDVTVAVDPPLDGAKVTLSIYQDKKLKAQKTLVTREDGIVTFSWSRVKKGHTYSVTCDNIEHDGYVYDQNSDVGTGLSL